MQRGFGGTAFEPVEEGRDVEITVGPMILTGFVVVLVALCAGCFIAGYSAGHRSPKETATAPPTASGPSAAQLLRNSPSKPGASQASTPAATDADAAPATDATSETAAETAPAADQPSASTAAPAVVQSALPAQSTAQPASATGAVQSALPQAGQWMVQIAAVSHTEDADVLLNALRKRGYTVSARHDPVDNLLHVQVGPFNNHNDATAMRQKLLSDGYNAVIQP